MIKIDLSGVPVLVWLNKLLPFKPYTATTVWPVIFVRSDMTTWNDVLENHERIHALQQLEILVAALLLTALLYSIGCGWWSLAALPLYFYCYVIGYLVRRWYHRQDQRKAYRKSAFEAEAYANERDLTYLQHRKMFAWVQYLWK